MATSASSKPVEENPSSTNATTDKDGAAGTQPNGSPAPPATAEDTAGKLGLVTALSDAITGHHDKKDEEEVKSAKTEEKKDDGAARPNSSSSSSSASSGPAGGFDSTPIPTAPPGYTLRFTIHSASNLPMADINSLSSDPYIIAQLYTSLPQRHKTDPPLTTRTPTVRRDVNPQWDWEWVVANVPASGFRLKCRVYDEDPADHDDRLGNASIVVGPGELREGWAGIRERTVKIKKRMGSKRAYLAQTIAAGVKMRKHIAGYVSVSVEMMGRTESEHGGRAYTVGPMWCIKHYSPLLGRMVNQKTPGNDSGAGKPKTERYNFQANQLQMTGPVPAEMYHRYVEFRPFVKRMFTKSGVRGYFLQKALQHQHAQIYHFDRTTEWTRLPNGPDKNSTLQFLELVHYDTGGRIFTYVLSLDALFCFTETGKEFGIDMLSKHTMHSDVSTYIAFSGEFLIRRRKGWEGKTEHHRGLHSPRLTWKRHRPGHSRGSSYKSHSSQCDEDGDNLVKEPTVDLEDDPPIDPAAYELVIDNDSGTYRPNAELLPLLKEFLTRNLPGLKIHTLDCQSDADEEARLKDEQRQRKKDTAPRIIYRQASRSSSISSSAESALDAAVAAGGDTKAKFRKTVRKDLSRRGKREVGHWKVAARGKRVVDGNVVVETNEDEDNGTKETKTNGINNHNDAGEKVGEMVKSEEVPENIASGGSNAVQASSPPVLE